LPVKVLYLSGHNPRRLVAASGPLTPLAFFAFAALDLWLIWRIIPPNLAP
jgi:hypothetical protein